MLRAVRGHHIWPKPLGPQTIVVDAGAHRGQFSEILIRDYGCRCYLIEANPAFALALKVEGAAGIVSGALAARDGVTGFHSHMNPESGSILPGLPGSSAGAVSEVEMISLGTLMKRFNLTHIDLLKLDIEGAEFELLEATPDSILQSITQITVEFHDFQTRFAGQELFARAKATMKCLGFVCCQMAFRTHGDVLFINARVTKLPILQRVHLRLAARFVERAKAFVLGATG